MAAKPECAAWLGQCLYVSVSVSPTVRGQLGSPASSPYWKKMAGPSKHFIGPLVSGGRWDTSSLLLPPMCHCSRESVLVLILVSYITYVFTARLVSMRLHVFDVGVSSTPGCCHLYLGLLISFIRDSFSKCLFAKAAEVDICRVSLLKTR